MLQTVISVLSPFVAAGLAWLAFIRQTRRNSVMQVYLDAAQATYEAERMIALRMHGHVNKESLSAEEHEEISKAFSSLLGRIGKLHLVASPKTMKAVNEFYNALYEIYDGIIQDRTFPTPTGAPIFTDMTATDVPAQIDRFDRARIPLLSSMRKDLGYRMRSLLIEHNSFTETFFRDRIKDDKALASVGEIAGRLFLPIAPKR
jgi:hypothetical protein